MRHFILLFFVLLNIDSNAQVTVNPKISRKSQDDVFINKIEITSKYTIFSMQFVSKSEKDNAKEYFKKNPQLKEQLQNMNPFMRQMILEQMKGEFSSSNTISFQPTSFIRGQNNKKFKFIKVEGIPTSPDRIETESGKKYPFKVYFEKLPAGLETIDMIESNVDKSKSMTYWNFEGIKINNPLKQTQELKVPEEKEELPIVATEKSDFRLYGKAIDASTNKSISAKIICKNKGMIDSLQTSKSGSYEFVVQEDDNQFIVTANGYQPLEENINVKAFRSKGAFNQDLYLEPVHIKDTVKVAPEKPVITEVGEAVDESKSSFKLDKVYFELGEARVLEESHEQLDNLVRYLKENQKLKIQIESP